MKICYIWVERFRNFSNFGLNLASSIKFEYNFEKNLLSKKEVEPLPNNFFGKQISDVTGIFGKNGSGKSNAIELLCKVLKGSKTSLRTNFFFIVEDRRKLTCFFSSYNKLPEADFQISFREYEGTINPLKIIYFSNVFDERKNAFDKDISDISVNNLFTRNPFSRKNSLSNFEKQIRLINFKDFSSLNIDLPLQVQITSKVWLNRANVLIERKNLDLDFQELRRLKSVLRTRLREMKPENKFIHLLRFGVFFETLNSIVRNFSYANQNKGVKLKHSCNKFIHDLQDFKATEEISESVIDFLEHLSSEMLPKEYEKNSIEDVRETQFAVEKIKQQLHFLRNWRFPLQEFDLSYDIEGSRGRGLEYFTFDYTSTKSKNFLNEYIKLFGQSDFFDINWLGISSGHKAYLNLFASIYQELTYTRQKNLLICIDEGDLYLHPMWQIEFFNKLMSVLPSFFHGKIQVILTSHSPFLLSDLPNQNITILDKNKPTSSWDGIDLSLNTFGGNLYDLYAKPFFLGDKKTSEFAYKKLKKLITSVEKGDFDRAKRRDLLKMANLVGDEIIKFRLMKILEDD